MIIQSGDGLSAGTSLFTDEDHDDDNDVTAVAGPLGGDTIDHFVNQFRHFVFINQTLWEPVRAEALIIINAARINMAARRHATRILPIAASLRSLRSGGRVRSTHFYRMNGSDGAHTAAGNSGVSLREISLINLINAPVENKLRVACGCASF